MGDQPTGEAPTTDSPASGATADASDSSFDGGLRAPGAESAGAVEPAPGEDLTAAPGEVVASVDDAPRSAGVGGNAASAVAFDDIVIPPRPPLPLPHPATGATHDDGESAGRSVDAESSDADDTDSGTPGLATPLGAETEDAAETGDPVERDDGAVEPAHEVVEPSDRAAEPADGALKTVSTSGSDDARARESTHDPAPADVAVEEPPTAAADRPLDSADTPSDDLDGAVPDGAVPAVEVVVETPLDADASVEGGAAASDEVETRSGDGVSPADGHEEAEEAAPRGAADVEDPTPPDVRSDDVAEPDATGAPTTDPATLDALTADPLTADDAPADADSASASEAAEDDAHDATAVMPVAGADETPTSTDPDAERSQPDAGAATPALTLRHITKTFGELRAVDAIDLTVPAGSFYGLVGPNGAGKTTTLSIIAGLLRADAGEVTINGVDARKQARQAKKLIGVLPDRLRTFDRLTGRQLLSYYGALRGLPSGLVESRMADLARAFDLVDALARPVSDYSAGMTKKVMLAGAMIHSPRLLVLDEPFEAVDPVSSGVILDILRTYVDHGGTVILSSHGMELVERVCSRVAVIVSGQVLAEGTVDEVRGEGTLEQRFRELSGGLGDVEGLEWLHTFSA
ncbi:MULTISPECIES: ATP-binding cassette domain-containing protein [Microbacterium]|uniref:ATP-binding cassette domain-containing protein n=1 Tax=Microbacterium TaxID=33882 RepID=UPI002784B9CA|nr:MULTISPECIES: ATP-binding cassette domain-containing protein [Microbacterium]MDQ1083872.1 ABC-2 type transport system ATP-binding protein [Microbacterium sp. SORGH_AS_0344]MDQ1170848.1 ABC-2 type transport system ATP-binding protein [Microbacterium proteolyticum]